MKVSQICKSIKHRLPLSIQFFMEVMSYWRKLCRYNASIRTDKDMQKMQEVSVSYIFGFNCYIMFCRMFYFEE